MYKFSILIFCLSFSWVNLFAHDRIPLNRNWKFLLGDQSGACEPVFDDSGWRQLDVPHDWAFENGYSPDGAQKDRGGYASGGIGWYRKMLELLPDQCESKRLFIHFDAVYMNSEVWINGHYLGKRPYGYISFEYEITRYVKPGKNLISVRVDNSLEPSARWYHGCGIYGNVSLEIDSPLRFQTWGTVITTPEIHDKKGIVEVKTRLDGILDDEAVELEYEILSQDNRSILKNRESRTADGLSYSWRSSIEDPILWDTENPVLYTLVGRIWKNGRVVDECRERFGFRTVEWKPETGFWLNGRQTKLRGVCEHLEGGPVGAAWTGNLMRWKVKKLKDMGCNAIRTAHNPQLPIFYDICDELGMLVMDEAFDGWRQKATEDYGKQAFASWWEKDLRAMIRRDRNHPSVVIYSVGNETRGEVAKKLVRVCHEEDLTRLVTSGHSASEHMDVFGVNGHSEKQSFILNYKSDGKAFIGTETPHTWQVRGYYRTQTWYRDGYPNKSQDPFVTPDLTKKEIFTYEWISPEKWKNEKQHFNSSYDNGFVRINARQNMAFLRDLPWYSGHFRWTGFDYLGEAGYVHGGWPFRAFMGGVIDMAGFEKDHYFLYQSEWTEKPMVHILPHWTHPDMKRGTLIPIWVYTTGDSAELFFNGKSLGKKKRGKDWDKMNCEWMVPWAPGELRAVAYRNGKEIASARQVSSGVPARLDLQAEDTLSTDMLGDMHILTISQQDRAGALYPYGENRVYFHIEGKAEIFSAENGDPVDVETNYSARSKKAFFGLLRVFIRKQDSCQAILWVGSILGDKRLKQGKEVSIDVRAVDLKGKEVATDYEVYYTIDGTKPTIASKRYVKPFPLPGKGMVKALVVRNGKELFMMEEEFGPDKGLYWGDGESVYKKNEGIQAELCDLKSLSIEKSLPGYEGKGYVSYPRGWGSLGFYQENDGSTHTAELVLSYALSVPGEPVFIISNNGKEVGRKQVRVTFEQVDQWRKAKIPFPLLSGANQIRITVISQNDVKIDWLKMNANLK